MCYFSSTEVQLRLTVLYQCTDSVIVSMATILSERRVRRLFNICVRSLQCQCFVTGRSNAFGALCGSSVTGQDVSVVCFINIKTTVARVQVQN